MTSAAAYTDALTSAYARKTPDSIISAVKQVIINQLHEMDPRVEIESTDFFNHTFAPDFVLRWSSDKVTRQLFVRQSSSDPYFPQEVQNLTDRSPIIFSLEPAVGHMRLSKNAEADARESDTLLTDAPGLSEIKERRSGSRVLDVASPSILQGAKGVLDEARAETVASGIAHGFVAAASLSVDETREAVSLFRYFFKTGYASRLTQFLRAVWVGAGGEYDRFPSDTTIDRELSPEALSFLLQVPAPEDLSFWRRVGYGLTISKLLRLDGVPSRNFDLLVRANLDRIQARAVTVAPRDGRSSQALPAWSQDGHSLLWHGLSTALAFVEAKRALSIDILEESDGLDLESLLDRAHRHSVPLEHLELVSNGRIVSYGAARGRRDKDVTSDEELTRLIATLGSSALARRATVTLPDAKTLSLDFERLVGSGRSGAKFSLRDLMRHGGPLLADLSDADVRAVAEMIAESLELTETLPLF